MQSLKGDHTEQLCDLELKSVRRIYTSLQNEKGNRFCGSRIQGHGILVSRKQVRGHVVVGPLTSALELAYDDMDGPPDNLG